MHAMRLGEITIRHRQVAEHEPNTGLSFIVSSRMSVTGSAGFGPATAIF
jgi:hypothetical protein